MLHDVVIVGGGPAGLAAALLLGRARKRVVLCDAGPARNAAAREVMGFVTRDGTPPGEFRKAGREELRRYGSVVVREGRVEAITGEVGAFEVRVGGEVVSARRVLLCLGVVDELPALPGYRELWGTAVFQCPYCHGWEVQDRAFGYLAPAAETVTWGAFLRGWSRDVVVFTDGAFEVPADAVAILGAAGVGIEERRIAGLVVAEGGAGLAAVELVDGTRVARSVMFVRPPQRQMELVAGLGLALDEHGSVRIDDTMQTSRPGIYAAGDVATHLHGALVAAAEGARAAYALNHELTMELVSRGELG